MYLKGFPRLARRRMQTSETPLVHLVTYINATTRNLACNGQFKLEFVFLKLKFVSIIEVCD